MYVDLELLELTSEDKGYLECDCREKIYPSREYIMRGQLIDQTPNDLAGYKSISNI